MRVLMIETERATAVVTKAMLEREGMVVSVAFSAEKGLELARFNPCDLIVTELVLDGGSGHRLIKAVRESGNRTPIIAVTQTGRLEDKREAFRLGVDDYVTKPFDDEELVMRIRAVVRRCHNHATSQIAVGGLVVDIDHRLVKVDGQPVPLTATEYLVLEALMLLKGQVVTRKTLMGRVYDRSHQVEPVTMNAYASRVSRKLQAAARDGHDYIRNIKGRGYQVVAPEGVAVGEGAPSQTVMIPA